ncbi:MAG: hypothetical protein IPO87_17545 [Flavobacteriales bacterium]|nr:hypothetical protein [Flavobacteriales bacterium]
MIRVALQVVQTPGTGLSYQWQSSTTGSGGPWIVVGSNTPFHSTTQIQTTLEAMITCGTPNGGSAYTTPVQVTQKVHGLLPAVWRCIPANNISSSSRSAACRTTPNAPLRLRGLDPFLEGIRTTPPCLPYLLHWGR